jgi:uncharacterized phiE125 gp8 family phage protein
MSLQVVTAPTEEPVTLDEARASATTAYADLTDAPLAALITSARIRLERYLGRAVAEQTLALHRPCFPYGGIVLEWAAPLQSIETFSYRPYGGGAAIEIEEDVDFMLDPYAEPAIVYPYSGGWPVTASHPLALTVTYVAGWAQADVPEPLKGALLGELAAVAASASTWASGGVRSMSIEGLGTLNYQGATAAGGEAMLQSTTRALVDSYRIPFA